MSSSTAESTPSTPSEPAAADTTASVAVAQAGGKVDGRNEAGTGPSDPADDEDREEDDDSEGDDEGDDDIGSGPEILSTRNLDNEVTRALVVPPEPSGSMRGRLPFAVQPSELFVRTVSEILPETPQVDGGLFSLVAPVARRALDFGLRGCEPGFHVFVAADPEVMIEEELVRNARRFVEHRPTPGDLVYVHDFDNPESPQPLLLPPGAGPALVEAMEDLVDGLHERLPQITETEEVARSQSKLSSELEVKTRQLMHGLESHAKTHGFGVRTVQGALQTYPILHGKPVSAEQFDVLDETTKKALQRAADLLTREVEKTARLVRVHNARIEQEQSATMARAAAALILHETRDLFERFAGMSKEVARYLRRVRQALTDDWQDFFEPEPSRPGEPPSLTDDPELQARLGRFRVNLLCSHRVDDNAPVIYETNPSFPNLFGYIERRAQMGTLITDFTRIRPGAMHHALGGVLILRAADVLSEPLVWERLKRVLREGKLAPEEPVNPLGPYTTTLRPAGVPISVRVVMVGTPDVYDALREADNDFATMFRIKVEVEPVVERTPQNLIALDAHFAAIARERGWARFDRAARARLLDLSTRLAEDRERLALCVTPLEETAAFACAAARVRAETGTAVVTEEDIDIAWRDRRERLGASERHFRELALRGEVALDTQGSRVGVVNGLSVFHTGDVEFGQPLRITAVVALGREGIIDVEREAQLGGAIHTKGVAILRGYLSRMFGQERPLSLRAQLVFEQSYGEIEGDSASSSELFAVLSALSDVGIDQGIAVTGSVNQLGEIQAIGGLCAKIEGFYDLCAARGLTGTQGVLIPRSNLAQLVLRADVVRAVSEGRFHVYAIATVAQGIEVLMGLPAGDRDAAGRFPAASVFGRVERRIIEIAERLRQAEAHGFGDEGGIDEGGGGEMSENSDYRMLKPAPKSGGPRPRSLG